MCKKVLLIWNFESHSPTIVRCLKKIQKLVRSYQLIFYFKLLRCGTSRIWVSTMTTTMTFDVWSDLLFSFNYVGVLMPYMYLKKKFRQAELLLRKWNYLWSPLWVNLKILRTVLTVKNRKGSFMRYQVFIQFKITQFTTPFLKLDNYEQFTIFIKYSYRVQQSHNKKNALKAVPLNWFHCIFHRNQLTLHE